MRYLIGLLGLIALSIGVWNFGGEELEEKQQNQFKVESQKNEDLVDELENYQVTAADFVNADELISNEVTNELSQTEIEGLKYMREEEKLARDVYLALYEYWNIPIFNNIAGSESTHMSAVLTLLEKYNLTDPASDKRGEFTNNDLQALYNQLVAEGKKTKAAAFTVGAKIEDLDIRDLEENINATDNQDIRIVYESLQRGSRNHLRAFNRQLINETGTNYEPEFMSVEEFNALISTGVEKGNVQGQGNQGSFEGGQNRNSGQGQGTGSR